MIARIDEILKTGTLKGLNNIANTVKTINLLKEITGVGNAKAKQWIKEGLMTIEDVIKAKNMIIEENLATIQPFGNKHLEERWDKLYQLRN